MKLFDEDIALEFAKTLISTDQRELIKAVAKKKMTTAEGIAVCSFELAEAFVRTAKARGN
jgi:hypothetical protein